MMPEGGRSADTFNDLLLTVLRTWAEVGGFGEVDVADCTETGAGGAEC